MKRFKKARCSQFRKERNENYDCTVIALSILGRMSYTDAHGYCKAEGRKLRKGLYIDEQLEAYEKAGLVVTEIENVIQPNGSKYTSKTIGSRFNKGYYLVKCNKHVFALVNGDVEDWTRNTKKRVLRVFKVTKPRKVH